MQRNAFQLLCPTSSIDLIEHFDECRFDGYKVAILLPTTLFNSTWAEFDHPTSY